MNFPQIFSKKRLIFLALFFGLVLIAQRINFSPVIGAENQYFTVFQFFGPIAGSFLGSVFGMLAVFLAEITDFLVVGKAFTLVNVLRLLPMLFAVVYFANFRGKMRLSAVVPLACIGLFILHPVGREAWLFSLYWLIPVLAVLLPEKVPGKLFFRSFGATFTAHAIGSVVWLYTVPMSAEQWLTLIPIVAYERFLFGIGIAGSFVVFNTVLDYVVDKWKISVPNGVLAVEKTYSLRRLWIKA